jgi:hypothetical protein
MLTFALGVVWIFKDPAELGIAVRGARAGITSWATTISAAVALGARTAVAVILEIPITVAVRPAIRADLNVMFLLVISMVALLVGVHHGYARTGS